MTIQQLMTQIARDTFPFPLPEDIVVAASEKVAEKLREIAPPILIRAVLDSAKKPVKSGQKKPRKNDPDTAPKIGPISVAKP
jgi:hypothetical protein